MIIELSFTWNNSEVDTINKIKKMVTDIWNTIIRNKSMSNLKKFEVSHTKTYNSAKFIMEIKNMKMVLGAVKAACAGATFMTGKIDNKEVDVYEIMGNHTVRNVSLKDL